MNLLKGSPIRSMAYSRLLF